MKIGKDYHNTPIKMQQLHNAIESMEWRPWPTRELPIMHEFGIQELLVRAGTNPDVVGYGVYEGDSAIIATRANYLTGSIKRATIYGVDTGHQLVLVAVDEENRESRPS